MGDYLSQVKDEVTQEDGDQKMIDGRDINVCIRARPLLDYEKEQGYFDTTQAL
jgi:hypothetical protein